MIYNNVEVSDVQSLVPVTIKRTVNGVTEKKAYKWNALQREFRPYYRLQFDYTCVGYEVAYSKWDKAGNDWNEAMEKSIYTFEMDNLVSVNHMRRSSEHKEFRTVDSVLMLNPTNDIILAEAFH